MPGTLKLIATDVAARTAICAKVRSIPYNLPMNSADTTHDVPVFARSSDTPKGSAKLAICCGTLSTRSAPSIIAGSAASDDRVLNATICAGNTARANSGSDTRPNNATTR